MEVKTMSYRETMPIAAPFENKAKATAEEKSEGEGDTDVDGTSGRYHAPGRTASNLNRSLKT